ncbi:uncharacterized protein DEA37_0006012 [Paragonimus westermani]|uniref:Uncharacterized protein n=1 Tax=Paragonimus westermani TaxID=34504 RepID=A0A5J4NU01_9TREM|nr:uncharacterized protein DEA37_0006012 [Paragonimus westermani]
MLVLRHEPLYFSTIPTRQHRSSYNSLRTLLDLAADSISIARFRHQAPVTLCSSSGCNSASGTDEARDGRKLARKRSNPSTPSSGLDTVAVDSLMRHSRSSSGSRAMSGSGDQSHSASSVNQSRSQHSRRGPQRASSSNSVDSKEDDERALTSTGKKVKRTHHHHHRHSTDSVGISPPQTTYLSSSLSTAGENMSSVCSGSSRHNRK